VKVFLGVAFYAVGDDEAKLLQWFYRLSAEERAELMQKVEREP